MPTVPSPAVQSLLVVDDSAVQRAHAVRLSRALGIATIHEACHGGDALAQLDRLVKAGRRPDALIIDLEMPVMDGVQLIQQLCASGLQIPFILCSTREMALIGAVATMSSALNFPAAAALRKPYDEVALRDALACCTPRAACSPRLAAASIAVPVEAGELARAIESGDVVAHYQPKVDVGTGLLRGVEVLARWSRAAGSVSPDCFVPAAEAHGLIAPLTMSILDQSLAQAARWRSRGLDVSIAVNLSSSLLCEPTLVEQIGARLAAHGARPEQVTFEITEGSVVAYQGTALGSLARLRLQGYGLSIDDYGTGFSSMQQLARIPFTELKIDRSFVHGAHEHEHLRVILQSAIDMAARLSITSVAEGVETLEDWALVRQMNCGLAQGWLFGKAMPAEALLGWVKQHARALPGLRQSSPGTSQRTPLSPPISSAKVPN